MTDRGLLRMSRGSRGVSSVIGVVLLLGLTIAVVAATVAVGAIVLDDAKSNSQDSQAENAMTQMSSKISLVALGESTSQQFNLGDISDGDVTVKPDAGNVKLIHNNDSEEVLFDESYGAVVYEGEDTRIAYQGGGVFQLTGERSKMLSPPEYHYRSETLTFPIVRVSGEGTSSGTVQGYVSRSRPTGAVFPNASAGPEQLNPIQSGEIYVEIQSDYHYGWYEFFESRSDGEVDHFENNQTVRADLSVPFNGAYDSAVGVTDGYDNNANGNHDPIDSDSITEGVNYPSVNTKIEDLIDKCESEPESCQELEDHDDPYGGNETYWYNGSESMEFEDVIFDTTDGDIDVVIDSSLDMGGGSNDLMITGDNTVTFYLTGDPGFNTNGIINNRSADQLTFYVHSSVDSWETNDNLEGNGIIYAPNTEITVDGSFEWTGSIIARSLTYTGSGGYIAYDEDSLSDKEISVQTIEDEIRYLHVTENVVEVDIG